MPERIVRDLDRIPRARQTGLRGLRQILPGRKILQKNFRHAAEIAGFAFHEKRGSVRTILIASLRQSEEAQSRQAIEQRLGTARRDTRFLRNSLRVGGIPLQRSKYAVLTS